MDTSGETGQGIMEFLTQRQLAGLPCVGRTNVYRVIERMKAERNKANCGRRLAIADSPRSREPHATAINSSKLRFGEVIRGAFPREDDLGVGLSIGTR